MSPVGGSSCCKGLTPEVLDRLKGTADAPLQAMRWPPSAQLKVFLVFPDEYDTQQSSRPPLTYMRGGDVRCVAYPVGKVVS